MSEHDDDNGTGVTGDLDEILDGLAGGTGGLGDALGGLAAADPDEKEAVPSGGMGALLTTLGQLPEAELPREIDPPA